MSPNEVKVPEGTVIDLPEDYHERVRNANVLDMIDLRRLGILATSRLEDSGFILGQE